MIYSFKLPDHVLANAKRPYDSDYHTVLFYCAQQLKWDWNYNSIVTGSTIFVDINDDDQYKKFAIVVGELTAWINRMWPTRARIVFDIEDDYHVPLGDMYHYIERASKAEYELFTENYDLNPQPSLFGRNFILPYEKTPTFFREGVRVNERVLS